MLLVLFAMLAALLLRAHLTTPRGKGSTDSSRDQTVAHCRPLWWPTIDPPIPRGGSTFVRALFLS